MPNQTVAGSCDGTEDPIQKALRSIERYADIYPLRTDFPDLLDPAEEERYTATETKALDTERRFRWGMYSAMALAVVLILSLIGVFVRIVFMRKDCGYGSTPSLSPSPPNPASPPSTASTAGNTGATGVGVTKDCGGGSASVSGGSSTGMGAQSDDAVGGYSAILTDGLESST